MSLGSQKATALYKRITLILLAAYTVALLGCQGKRTHDSTPVLVQPETLCLLDPAQLRDMNASHLEQWIEETFEISPSSYQRPDGSVVYIWGEPESGTIFGNAVVSEGYVKKIRLETPSTYTFGDVVSSFGDPATISLYATRYETVLYTIALNYPQRGISLLTNESHPPTSAITLHRDMTLKVIECYPPNTEEEETNRSDEALQLEWPGFGATIPLP